MNSTQSNTQSRGVSPVIGVVLMVAVTVMMAAVIGTMVMDLGGNVQQNAQASVSYSNVTGDIAEVQLTDQGNVDDPENIEVRSGSCDFEDADSYTDSGPKTFESVGDTISLKCGSGDQITVVASIDGSENVVASYTYDG